MRSCDLRDIPLRIIQKREPGDWDEGHMKFVRLTKSLPTLRTRKVQKEAP